MHSYRTSYDTIAKIEEVCVLSSSGAVAALLHRIDTFVSTLVGDFQTMPRSSKSVQIMGCFKFLQRMFRFMPIIRFGFSGHNLSHDSYFRFLLMFPKFVVQCRLLHNGDSQRLLNCRGLQQVLSC